MYPIVRLPKIVGLWLKFFRRLLSLFKIHSPSAADRTWSAFVWTEV